MQHVPGTLRFAVGLGVTLGFTLAISAASPDTPMTEPQAVAELKKIGGVLLHYDERLPGRPVISVDFNSHPNFQEDCLKYVAALPHVSTLGLAGTPLTDSGLRYLKNLQELDTLILAQTKITDEGLAELLKLKKLRLLDVRGTEVTAAGANALRRFLPDLEVEFGPMPSGSEPPTTAQSPPQNQDQAEPTPISVAKISELRKKAQGLWQPSEGQQEPEGWSKSRVDPAQLVEIFQPLRMRKGLALRAYVFRENSNGNGVVWALPEAAEFPEPQDCPALEQHLLKAPKPSEALDDTMEAIEGDGSPASYLAASLLRRELLEFGASWHGCNWSTHFILGDNPWKSGSSPEEASPMERPASKPDQWKWLEPQPTEWTPRVRVEKDRVTVTFYTYCGLGKEAIFRHTDTYKPGKYRPKVEQKCIAEGPAGYMF